MIYAFDRAFEGSFAALAAPLVGILAERVFGYRVGNDVPESGSRIEALALSRGLLTVMAFPFALCCIFYMPLYATYRSDYAAVNAPRHHHLLPDEPTAHKRSSE
jgi:hypothetical protein